MRQEERNPVSEIVQNYDAAKRTRFRRVRTGINTLGSGADYHYRSESDYLRVMEYARDMDRNDAIVGQMVERAVLNTVQGGISLEFQTPDGKLNDDLAWKWYDWCSEPEQCDVAEEHHFCGMERFALRHTFVDGDIAFLARRDGSLHSVEAHRIRTPHRTQRNIIHGVRLDDYRRRLDYWVTNDDVDPLRQSPGARDFVAYPVRDDFGLRQVFHVYHPKRVSQTRGVSAFAPIFDSLGIFEDLHFAKMVQAQVVSCFAIFRRRELGYAGPNATAQTGVQTEETLTDGSVRTLQGIGPGMDITGAPGETLTGFSPQVPNPEFFPHVRLILQIIGVNLGMPLVLVLVDASDTNFSGWRGAIDQARMGFRANQEMLIRRFHEPVLRWKLAQWAEEDPALAQVVARMPKREGPLLAHTWQPPTWPYIEPKTDAEAEVVQLKGGLTSWTRRAHVRGMDQGEIAAERVRDIAKAISDAKAINAANPEAMVDWREVLGVDSVGDGSSGEQGVRAGSEPAGETQVAEDPVKALRDSIDTYGIGVRAGVVTPQTADEESFRQRLGLPPLSEDVQRAWTEDQGVRRPITLAPSGGKPATQGGFGQPAQPQPPREAEPEEAAEPQEAAEQSAKPARRARKIKAKDSNVRPV